MVAPEWRNLATATDEGGNVAAEDVLGNDPRPLFFPVENPAALGLHPPDNRHGMSLRTWVRSLSFLQKEALVVNGATGKAWRLSSDEGPYLAGFDVGPCPLSFLTTGMVSSYMNEITALARQRDVPFGNIRLTLDNYYTMEGSALRGTMTGGAKAPELNVEIDADTDVDFLRGLVAAALDASPINGLMRGVHTSLFTLSLNGEPVPLGQVAALGGEPHPDPGDRFPEVSVGTAPVAGELIHKLKEADAVEGVPGGAGTSLAEDQSRMLHVRGVCTLRDDGVKEIVQNLYKPIGSEFRYLSDEDPRFGGRGLAPDAATYMSAGIGFCFMTQFGRYAKIVKKNLDAYRIVQDTHFSLGGASGGTGRAGIADPVETHVYLDSREDTDFARTILDMSEQTCFLHAFCRTDLKARMRLATSAPAQDPS